MRKSQYKAWQARDAGRQCWGHVVSGLRWIVLGAPGCIWLLLSRWAAFDGPCRAGLPCIALDNYSAPGNLACAWSGQNACKPPLARMRTGVLRLTNERCCVCGPERPLRRAPDPWQAKSKAPSKEPSEGAYSSIVAGCARHTRNFSCSGQPEQGFLPDLQGTCRDVPSGRAPQYRR